MGSEQTYYVSLVCCFAFNADSSSSFSWIPNKLCPILGLRQMR